MTPLLPRLIGIVIIAAGGCATSQNRRHAEPYALLTPNGETAPDPLPDDTTLIDAEPPPEAPSMEPVVRRLTQARRLYRDLAFEASLEELRRAQQVLEAELEWAQTYSLLDRLLLLRGLDELALGRLDRAGDAFRQAALLRPDRDDLDPAEFSPEVRSAYARARDPLGTEAPFALSVESDPRGTQLVVDGAPGSRTPASVRLHRGRHYLVLRAPGYETETRVIDVDEDTEATLRIDLQPLGEPELDAAAFTALDAPQKKPLVRRWWFWTVIGVAVVGTTLGLYFGLRNQPEPQLVIGGP